MFCPSCGKQLIGGETFCPNCGMGVEQASQDKGMSASAVEQPIHTEAQAAPIKVKPGLHGFAKGWMIFVIVAYSASIASNLTYMTDPYKAGIESLTLNCKSSLDRDGEVLDRTEFEAVILPDGTLLFQFFHMEHPELNSTNRGNYAAFKRISSDSYSCIVTEIGSKFDFSYDSIIGKGDMKTEKMAQSYMAYESTRIFTVEDCHVEGDTVYGKVNYEAYEPDESLRETTMNTGMPDEKNSPAAGIKLNPSREFSDFYFALQDAEQTFHDLIFAYADAIPDLHDSTNVMMAFRDVINTNFWYDSFFDMQDGTHLLDWPVLEATRLTSGDIVVILVDDTLRDKYSNAEKGDHMRLEATLDTKNLTLSCERILERDGQYIERAVTEAAILPDGSILFQRFIVGVNDVYGGRVAVFKRISDGSYSALVADIGTDYDYTYKSIIGRGDMTTEEMARGYAVTHVFSIENGEVSYEEK